MRIVGIYDSTLQEGGHCNLWSFGRENIYGITRGLRDFGVDYYDVGLISNLKSTSDNIIINNNNGLQRVLKNGNNVESAVLTIDMAKPLPFIQLERLDFDGIKNIVKIKFYANSNMDYKEYIRYFCDKRMQVILQPVSCYQFEEHEFLDVLNLADSIGARAIYIDDSMGYGLNEKLLKYINISNNILHEDVDIIFKTRSEQINAISNLIEITKNWKRGFYCEGCLCGIGYGKMNVPTESIMRILGKVDAYNYTKDCKIQQVMAIIDMYLKKICVSQGCYSAAEEIYKSTTVSPCFAPYYSKKLKLLDSEIVEVLPEVKSTKFFTEKKADEILHNCRMKFWKKKMCIIVPTCNRSEAIKFYLNKTGVRLWDYGIDLIIFDSSDNDETKQAVEKYRNKGYKNIIYKHYDGYYDGSSLDHKLIEAYEMYWDSYEYIWICRDGIAINFDYIHMNIRNLLNKSKDVIVVDSEWRDIKKTGNKNYDDCNQFFRDQCIRMVTLGTIIVSSEFIKKVVEKIPIDNSNYSLWQVIAIFQYYGFNYGNVNAASFTGDVFVYNPKGTISSFWNTSGKALWQWAERWVIVIKSLPEIYNKNKSSIYKIEMVDFHPFSVKTLLLIKANGGLSFNNLNRYRKYLKYVSNRPTWQYYVIMILPIPKRMLKKFLMNSGTVYHRVCKQLYWILRDYIHHKD